jgi:hypothetical protein
MIRCRSKYLNKIFQENAIINVEKNKFYLQYIVI